MSEKAYKNGTHRNRCVDSGADRLAGRSVGRGRPLAARAPPVCVCGDAHVFPRFFRAYRKAIFGMRNFLSEWRGSDAASLTAPNGREAAKAAGKPRWQPRRDTGLPCW